MSETKQSTADFLAGTLVAILREYAEHLAFSGDRSRPALSGAFEAYRGGKPVSPRWGSALNEMERDPVRFTLKTSAREIGWRAWASGCLKMMHQVSDLAQDHGANGAIIDKWWDNIGCWEKGVWCA